MTQHRITDDHEFDVNRYSEKSDEDFKTDGSRLPMTLPSPEPPQEPAPNKGDHHDTQSDDRHRQG